MQRLSLVLHAAICASYVALILLVPSSAQQPTVARCPGSPNQCSLHGSCVLNRMGEHVCNCQWGYDGSDCSKRMCPHGVDPTSPLQGERKLRLVVSAPILEAVTASGSSQYSLQGKFLLTFHAHSVEFETPLLEMTNEACTKVFGRFQNLADVSCEQKSLHPPASAMYEITIHRFPIYPIMNNLYQHDGNPSINDFWCDAKDVKILKNGAAMNVGSDAVQCTFESIEDEGIKPYTPCSNHGLCNDKTGVCTCNVGYYGDNCANNVDEEDILVAPSRGPFFQGNVLRISAEREKSTDFNLIKADIIGKTVFTMNGDGDTVFHDGSVFIKSGDLNLQGGQLRVSSGSSVVMEGADLTMSNGQVYLHTSDEANSGVRANAPLLRLDIKSSALMGPEFIRLLKNERVLMRVTSSGTVVVQEGGIEVLNGGIKVQHGGVQVISDGVHVLQGGVEVVSDDVTVRHGDVKLFDGSLVVESSKLVQPAAKIISKANGLHIQSSSESSTLISGSIIDQGSPSFEVLASGETRIHSGGLKISSGGVEIASGGQIIHSGGLSIKSGGVTVENGALTTRDGFHIEDGGLSISTKRINGAVLSLSSSHKHYAGSMIELSVNQSTHTDPPFRLIDAVTADINGGIPDSIFTVESDGSLTTKGDIKTQQNGRIISGGALVSQAQVVFSHIKLLAGDAISIPSSHSYVKITSDGATTQNRVSLDSSAAYAGQLLVIQNEDEEPLDGDVSVKPSSAAIFVFDGEAWRALTAASFDTSVITGVKSFDAANDLNFGEIKLTVHNLQVTRQKSGLVAIYGKGGELTQDDQLKFDATTGLLTAEHLESRSIKGKIDMTQSELRGVEIVGGHISNVNMTDIEMVEVSGELFVEDQAFFGSGITVDGQVMGSGAYIDASDERFKTDLEPIDGMKAMKVVKQLQGVEYAYKISEFPTKKFSSRREIGFVAQRVEEILPEVVETDDDGFKYVAYARMVPVLVEAMKQQMTEKQELDQKLLKMEAEIQELRRMLVRNE